MSDPFENNYLIITIDSCRWDTFQTAKMNFLKSITNFKKAFTQGTFTLPAHKAIYQGITPSVHENIPYYNRFSKSLFRINHRKVKTSSLITFKKGTYDIIQGFNEHGFHTFGLGAVDWFRHDELTKNFQKFIFTGTDIKFQTELFFSEITNLNVPFFGLLNIGETHEPYVYGKQVISNLRSREIMREFKDIGILIKEKKMQIKACEYLDSFFEEIYKSLLNLSNGTVVLICADHGECFGESGLYGHGFYHPKVMEVPLGIFEVNCNIL